MGFGGIDVGKPYKIMGFGDIDAHKPYSMILPGRITAACLARGVPRERPLIIIGFGCGLNQFMIRAIDQGVFGWGSYNEVSVDRNTATET